LTDTDARAPAVLALLSLRELLDRLSSSDPVPGGGSAAALAGAMGASLISMVAALTVGRAEYAQVDTAAREIGEAASSLRDELIELAERDSDAYQAVITARRLPRETNEQRAARSHAMSDAVVQAAEVPLRTARVATQALELAGRIAPIGNRNAVSDAGVAALLTAAAIRGAILNVRINLRYLPEDVPIRAEAGAELVRLEQEATTLETTALGNVATRIG
jgi:formiminotetrahydrofolate cyclodeaminase